MSEEIPGRFCPTQGSAAQKNPLLVPVLFFFLAFSVFCIAFAVRPITDPDFWWHLAQGKAIFENGGLLENDFFSFTSDAEATAREKMILSGYWLWDLSVYYSFKILGFKGIYFFNLIVVVALAMAILWQIRFMAVDLWFAIPLIALGFFLFGSIFFIERPQIISFLCLSLLLGWMKYIRSEGGYPWLILPLMIFWANCHGGFAFGDFLLIIFSIAVIVEFWPNPFRIRKIIVWAMLGVAASFLNPNGWNVLIEAIQYFGNNDYGNIAEYKNTFVYFTYGSKVIVILWLMVLFLAVSMIYTKNVCFSDAVLFVCLAYFSTFYLRNVGFFAISILPMTIYYLYVAWKKFGVNLNLFAKYSTIIVSAFIMLYGVSSFAKSHNVASPFPSNIVKFINFSGIKGNMFNQYEWGGYLLWNLYPKHRVFIDGRGLDKKVHQDYGKISDVSLEKAGKDFEYKQLLEQYNISFVVQQHLTQFGRLQRLMKFLLNDQEWVPVFVDSTGYVLVKNDEENRRVIEIYGMDKKLFLAKLETLFGSDHVRDLVARCELMIYAGNYKDAELLLESIERSFPAYQALPGLRKQLQTLRH